MERKEYLNKRKPKVIFSKLHIDSGHKKDIFNSRNSLSKKLNTVNREYVIQNHKKTTTIELLVDADFFSNLYQKRLREISQTEKAKSDVLVGKIETNVSFTQRIEIAEAIEDITHICWEVKDFRGFINTVKNTAICKGTLEAKISYLTNAGINHPAQTKVISYPVEWERACTIIDWDNRVRKTKDTLEAYSFSEKKKHWKQDIHFDEPVEIELVSVSIVSSGDIKI
ncbi:hypothetical protein [Pseudalkalibacillus caeni]|uniref:Uncharacterized protein n=1 Tax=Exobacillus caeni TaxID=2574798 RepID=A0A5R9F1F0_9BACL|nr:hypothetical protein [Pseudalkalibacillus caeni]TLS37462.1 hypothetical protein FCL54_09965 [Pseudalkalibacillus caeni]